MTHDRRVDDDVTLAPVLDALLAMQRHSWEQGVLSHAVLDLRLDHLVLPLAADAVLHEADDGRLGHLGDAGLVNCGALGEVVLRAAARTGSDRYLDAFDRQVRWLVETCPRAADGTLLHLEGTHEVWVDSVYMLVPVLVLAGRPDEALRQLRGHADRLFDPSSGLYAHQYDEDSRALLRAAHWGTGNGWVVAGLARAVHLLADPTHELHTVATAHARTVVDACLAHREADGTFHDVLDDRSTFTELNVAQMLAYALFTGVADGWLPPDPYTATARSLLATAVAHVGPEGFVEPVCGAPHFDRPGRSAEAQAFHLLALAAARR